jgi:hypothetical protein
MRPVGITPKYDGYTKKGVEKSDEWESIYYRDNGICQTCGLPVEWVKAQAAHCIANTKANRQKYGDYIIDHALNRKLTHGGGCNDAQNIGNNPGKCNELVLQINAIEAHKNRH